MPWVSTLLPVKPTVFKPQRLDVAAFARAGAVLEGQVSVPDLPRLNEGTCPPDDAPPEVACWKAVGWQKEVLGGSPEVWLRLQARTVVWLTCQRCLQPLRWPLEVDRSFRFMPDEEQAAQLDEVSDEEDVLALTRSLDLCDLMEDELIMALPIVPRHETCATPLLEAPSGPSQSGERQAVAVGEGEDRLAASDAAHEAGRSEHPFAVLKALKLKHRS